MKVYTEITADLQKVSATQDIRAAVGDTGRAIRVLFSQNGEPYTIEKDCYAVLMGTKPDGTSLYNSCHVEDNAVIYDFTEQTCSCPGSYPVQVRLYGPDRKILTSVPLEIHVYDTVYEAEQAAASQNEQTALDELVNRTRGLMLDLARKQETGGFDGESAYALAVRLGYTGSEESWIQSLKYDHSAEFTALASQVRENTKKAASSAAGAEQAESAAAASASGADSSASAAAASEGHAAASESTASAASASAEKAAVRAEQAESAAAASASGADSSASAAAASEGHAAASETAASAASASAEKAAVRAEQAKSAAAASASGADSSATAAAASEGHAAASESTASAASASAEKAAVRAEQAAKSIPQMIDDRTVSTEKTQSSLKLYDALCLPFEQTGPVVTCHPVENYPLHTVSEIAVKQEDSHTPSVTDPNPLVVWNEARLTICGANLFNKEAAPAYVNSYIKSNGEIIQDASNNYSVYKVPISSGLYTFDIGITTIYTPAIVFFDRAGNRLGGEAVSGRSYLTLNVPEKTAYAMCSANKNRKMASNIDKFQIRKGRIPEGQYIPYIGKNFTARFSEPLACGVVDWEKKTATSNVTFINGLKPGDFAPVGGYFEALLPTTPSTGVDTHAATLVQYCNVAEIGNADAKDPSLSFAWGYAGGGRGYLRISRAVYDWLNAAPDRKLEFAYESLTTVTNAVTVSGTPTALPGVSNFCSDTGDTTVSGRQNPIYTAENLISRVTALENKAVKEI